MKGLLSCLYRSLQSYEIFFENGTLSSQKLFRMSLQDQKYADCAGLTIKQDKPGILVYKRQNSPRDNQF